MKILSIIGILFSLIGIIISILMLTVGINAVGATSMYTRESAGDYAAVIFIVCLILLIINLFFFAFSVVATLKSFKKRSLA